LRDAIAAKYRRTYGFAVDPETEVTVTCGATEGMIASLLAAVDPEDEVISFDPFYENYGPDIQLWRSATAHRSVASAGVELRSRGVAPRLLQANQGYHFNTPNNPTGKVFTREELEFMEVCAASSTRSPSPTKSTSTSCTTASGTYPW